MRYKKFFNRLVDVVSYNNMVTTVVFSLFLPIIAWMIELANHAFIFSVSNIVEIHVLTPTLFVVDIIPLIVGVLAYLIEQKRRGEVQRYEDEIWQRDQKINRNAEFAKKIGDGDYKTEFIISDDNDILGKSLLLMRDNLYENHVHESEQSWISEGKDLISGILRMHNKIDELAYDVLVNLINYLQVVQGAFYLYQEKSKTLVNISTYAFNRRKYVNQEFKLGEGLIGQCAFEMEFIYRTEIPDDYITITSGILGDRKPSSILIVPLITEEKLQGIIEFATLDPEISELKQKYLIELGEIIARTIFNLRVTEQTERLLVEAQNMTKELQENEEQLRQNAEEMRATQEELEKSNEQLGKQIKEVENAQKRLNSLLENASEIISIYDANQKMTYVSPSVRKILGFNSEEMMRGKDIERLTRKGEMEYKEMLQKLVQNPNETITIQYTYIQKDGRKIFLETTGRNLLQDTAIHGLILNTQDVTARKKAEKEERLRSRMQSLSENSLDMIIRINTLGQFFYANPMVEKYLGVNPNELMDKRFRDINLQEVFANYFSTITDQMKHIPEKTNTELVLKGNEEKEDLYMSIVAIPEFTENENELETILIVGHDITEAKNIEREIQEKNKKIEDSINYAQRIQKSILPDTRNLHSNFHKSFLYYKPRDVVSGDFPWMMEKDDIIFIAAVDCTGHGVPGALLSFIGHFTLNSVVELHSGLMASKILDKVHHNVRVTLNQDQPDAQQRDGMDIAFCRIDLNKNELQYAGAHRPLYLLRNDELIEFKGNRKAIGGIPFEKKEEIDFINHLINLQKGDKIFIFSDGLPDQVNEEQAKYTPKRLREVVLANIKTPFNEMGNVFEESFNAWKGKQKQTDDVLIIGIEF